MSSAYFRKAGHILNSDEKLAIEKYASMHLTQEYCIVNYIFYLLFILRYSVIIDGLSTSVLFQQAYSRVDPKVIMCPLK